MSAVVHMANANGAAGVGHLPCWPRSTSSARARRRGAARASRPCPSRGEHGRPGAVPRGRPGGGRPPRGMGAGGRDGEVGGRRGGHGRGGAEGRGDGGCWAMDNDGRERTSSVRLEALHRVRATSGKSDIRAKFLSACRMISPRTRWSSRMTRVPGKGNLRDIGDDTGGRLH